MNMQKANTKKTAEKTVSTTTEQYFVFGKQNYMLMLVGLCLLALGFYLMAGTEDIFSSTKLTVAPILVALGFVIEIFAIMRKHN